MKYKCRAQVKMITMKCLILFTQRTQGKTPKFKSLQISLQTVMTYRKMKKCHTCTQSRKESDPLDRVAQSFLAECLNVFCFILAACLLLISSFTEWKERLFKSLWRTFAPFFAKKSATLFAGIPQWVGIH